MKKILLATAAFAALTSSSAFAGTMGDFYLKGNVGWSKLDNVTVNSMKFKSKNDIHFGVGAGYYVMENVRAELAYNHFANPTFKQNNGGTSKVKANVDTVLVNGYVDLFDVSMFKFFLGAGIGYSHVDAKLKDSEYKAKATNNFGYALHVGASTELMDGVHGELAYSYRDMGKTKKFEKSGSPSLEKVSIKGHQVGVSVRFDI